MALNQTFESYVPHFDKDFSNLKELTRTLIKPKDLGKEAYP